MHSRIKKIELNNLAISDALVGLTFEQRPTILSDNKPYALSWVKDDNRLGTEVSYGSVKS